MKQFKTGKILKSLLTVALLSTLFVSCGKDNKTGSNSNSNGSGQWGGSYGGTYGGNNGAQLPGNFLDIIAQENPCKQGGQRVQAQLPLNQNINVGSLHVGVTSYGDIALIQNQGGASTMRMYICPRAGLSGQGQILSHPIVNNSQTCPIGEISSANMVLTGQQVNYQVIFRPISIPSMGVRSSLCSQQQGYY